MYGLLYCIRSLVLELDLDLPMRLFDLCMEISNIIAPVLKSDSPEGFLLEDHSSKSKVTAQILLLCAWRTSKEISLILGLIKNSQLIDPISDHFIEQLCEIKHRGAFEQAFIGFCQICSFMWQHEETVNRPQNMLFDTLKDLKQENKFCSTRRSAGLSTNSVDIYKLCR